MTSDYNGWTNYETWVTALWIDNEQGSYQLVRETATEIKSCATDNWVLKFADWLKDYIEESSPTVNGLYADLLSAAIGEINWLEIAKNIADE